MSIHQGTGASEGASLASGWSALRRGAWDEAREVFASALHSAETPEALEGLSWATWWLNDAAAMFDARERAYRSYRSAGDPAGAARMATWLGTDHVDFRGELAVGQGWLRRAHRLLDDLPPGPEHGWLAVHEAEKALYANEVDLVRELGIRAGELGRRARLLDLEMMGLATEGLSLVTAGHVADGMSRLDEAAAAALGDGFAELWSVGWCCCYVIYGCERAHDYDRAAQWCRRVEDWSARMGTHVVNRTCRAHYAGVLVRSGAWDEAERELVVTAEHLAAMRPPMVSEAQVRLAELRRRQGRLEEAAQAFEELGGHPLALLGAGEVSLDRGEAAAARDRALEYLRDAPPHTPTLRAAGLELLARASAELGDGPAAAEAAGALGSIADQVGTVSLRASARLAAGVAAAALGQEDAARTALEDATRLFHRSDAPFEAARARIELARALSAAGRPRDAAREAASAATSLRRIGALRDADRAGALAERFEGLADRPDRPLSPRECEVLRLVAGGRGDKAVAEALVISEHTVHRHVANILFKLGCSSRSAAVAEALRRGVI